MGIKLFLKSTQLYKAYTSYLVHRINRRKAKRIRLFKKEGEKTLNLFAKALNDNHIVFWLEFGTLLGFYREHDFIAHDFDLDMGAYASDKERIYNALIDNGFIRVRQYHTLNNVFYEECYRHKTMKTTIDVFFFVVEGEFIKCPVFCQLYDMHREIGKEHPFSLGIHHFPVTSFSAVSFKGVSVYVPSDLPKHLEVNYGETFMIPNPNFQNSSQPNVKYYDYDEIPCVGTFYEKGLV